MGDYQVKEKLLRLFFGVKGSEQLEQDQDSLGGMYRRVLSIAWPAALEGLLMSLMNSFDTMMVGRLGPQAIASVGLCAQPRMILLLIEQALCVGTTAVVARRKGAGDQAAANSCLKQSLVIITGIGILMIIAGYFLAVPLLKLAGAMEDTLPDAVTYFRIISLAFVANCWTLCICAAQRGIGRTRITMTVNMAANIVNVFLNYCLISGHLGFPALGVKGAAIATASGTIVSCLMAIRSVLPRDGYLKIRPWGKLQFDAATVKSLVTVGSGTIAESVFLRIGFLINGRLIAGVSTAAYATTQIVQQITGLTFTVGDGIASACTSMVGQSLGAGKKWKAKLYVSVGQKISLCLSILLILLTFFGRRLFPTLFTDDPVIIQAASLCFVVILVGIHPQNMRVMLSGCLRGAGDVKYVALVSLISVAIVRPLTTWLFCYPLNAAFPTLMLGFIGSWLSFDLDSLIRYTMLTSRVRKGKWADIKL